MPPYPGIGVDITISPVYMGMKNNLVNKQLIPITAILFNMLVIHTLKKHYFGITILRHIRYVD